MQVVIPYRPNARQAFAHAATEKHILFGGAVRGGKSVWQWMEAVRYGLSWPGNRSGVFRWEYANFSHTTWKTAEDWVLGVPGLVADHNQNRREITLFNGSQIVYGGLKPSSSSSGDLLSVARSLEVNSLGVDEASDLPEKVYRFLCTRVPCVRCRMPDGSAGYPPGRVNLTSNPCLGWIKSMFIDQRLPNHRFILSTIRDNQENLAVGYRDEVLAELAAEDAAGLVDGDWGAVVDYAAVCPMEMVAAAAQRRVAPGRPAEFGVDVAAGGGDLTVVTMRQGYRVWVLLAKSGKEFKSTMDTVGAVAMLAARYRPTAIKVDAIGVGKGVFDRLAEMGLPAVEFISGEKSLNPLFRNRRAEAWWEVRQMLEAGLIQLPNHPELLGELGSVRYIRSPSDRTIQVESKETLKKRIGKSPNYADSLVYCLEGASGQYMISGLFGGAGVNR